MMAVATRASATARRADRAACSSRAASGGSLAIGGPLGFAGCVAPDHGPGRFEHAGW